ncbi:hypothetical protein KIPB_015205, partial [Kipferlia bialata]
VTKVKTVGDAYEVMRAFTATEMATRPVESIVQSIADMASFSLEMLHSCQATFAATGVPLHVRCGLAVGPAFACVIGSVRVSYDIFGLAPARARLMEELSPVGNVTVSRDVYELLSAAQGPTSLSQSFGCVASATFIPLSLSNTVYTSLSTSYTLFYRPLAHI